MDISHKGLWKGLHRHRAMKKTTGLMQSDPVAPRTPQARGKIQSLQHFVLRNKQSTSKVRLNQILQQSICDRAGTFEVVVVIKLGQSSSPT